MIVQPYGTIRVTPYDDIELDVAGAVRAVIQNGRNQSQEVEVVGGVIKLPRMVAPDYVCVEWYDETEFMFQSFLKVVSRHYFKIDELKQMDDSDDFSSVTDDEFLAARQAATETFETNACRSFVKQVGSTTTYTGGFVWLEHNDVSDILTPGWQLASDCQAVGPKGRAEIRYIYGVDEMPVRVSEAVMALAAYYLRPSVTPDRATGEATEAGFIRYTLAGRDGATGLPEVDAIIDQFGRKRVDVR